MCVALGCAPRRGRQGAAPSQSRAPGKAGGHRDILGGELRSLNVAWLEGSLPADGGWGGGCRVGSLFLAPEGSTSVCLRVIQQHRGPRSECPGVVPSERLPVAPCRPHAGRSQRRTCPSVCVHRCVGCAQVCQVCTGVSAVLSWATWCGFSLATSSRTEKGRGAPVRHWACASSSHRMRGAELGRPSP